MNKFNLESISQVINESHEPLTPHELAKSLGLKEDTSINELEEFLKENINKLGIKLVNVKSENEKENTINYILRFTKIESKAANYHKFTDEELIKYYQGTIVKLNKLKEERKKLDETETKKKFIKALHQYNELKDTCQVVLGKIAEIQNKTIIEIHEEYGLDPED